jgi:hypothetical protein
MNLTQLLALLKQRTDVRYFEIQVFLENGSVTQACVQITVPEEHASYLRHVLLSHGIETITSRVPTSEGQWYRETFPVNLE